MIHTYWQSSLDTGIGELLVKYMFCNGLSRDRFYGGYSVSLDLSGIAFWKRNRYRNPGTAMGRESMSDVDSVPCYSRDDWLLQDGTARSPALLY